MVKQRSMNDWMALISWNFAKNVWKPEIDRLDDLYWGVRWPNAEWTFDREEFRYLWE